MFCPTLTLTINNARTVLEEGLRAIEGGQTSFDLAELTVVDSAAVAILLAWRRAALARSQPLVFRNIPPALTSIAALYGVAEILAPVTEARTGGPSSTEPGTAARMDLPHR